MYIYTAGNEYEIVLLSTVRSLPLDEITYIHEYFTQPDRHWMRENLGFITNKHQINVGITRSKSGLIITGKFTVLNNDYTFVIIIGNKMLLECDGTWRSLLQHYEEKQCIVKDSRFSLSAQ